MIWVSGNSRIIMDDVVAFYEILKNKERHKKLYLFIKSGGGKASLRIIKLLREYYEEIVALVPLDCALAATMLALMKVNFISINVCKSKGIVGYFSSINIYYFPCEIKFR